MMRGYIIIAVTVLMVGVPMAVSIGAISDAIRAMPVRPLVSLGSARCEQLSRQYEAATQGYGTSSSRITLRWVTDAHLAYKAECAP